MHTPHDGNLGNTNVRIMICSEYKRTITIYNHPPSITIPTTWQKITVVVVSRALRGKFMEPLIGAAVKRQPYMYCLWGRPPIV